MKRKRFVSCQQLVFQMTNNSVHAIFSPTRLTTNLRAHFIALKQCARRQNTRFDQYCPKIHFFRRVFPVPTLTSSYFPNSKTRIIKTFKLSTQTFRTRRCQLRHFEFSLSAHSSLNAHSSLKRTLLLLLCA